MEREEALEGVKIGRFLRSNMPVTGVIHVGTNWGEEIMYYRALGLKVIGFEPLEHAFSACLNTYGDDPEVEIFNYGLGSATEVLTMHETFNPERDDSGGSSFLKEITPMEHREIKQYPLEVKSYNKFLHENPEIALRISEYNCLVVDTQGMEMDVLLGMGDWLKNFICLNIECSREPAYEGEATAYEVIAYLDEYNFQPITPVENHDDILFVRRDYL